MSPERDEIAARLIQVEQNLARLERKRALRGGDLNLQDQGQVTMLRRRREQLQAKYDALAGHGVDEPRHRATEGEGGGAVGGYQIRESHHKRR